MGGIYDNFSGADDLWAAGILLVEIQFGKKIKDEYNGWTTAKDQGVLVLQALNRISDLDNNLKNSLEVALHQNFDKRK